MICFVIQFIISLTDKGNNLKHPVENYKESISMQTNFKLDSGNKDDIDIEQVLGGHIIVAGTNEDPSEKVLCEENPPEKELCPVKEFDKRKKRYNCTTCNKKFEFNSTLHIHMLSHNKNQNEKPFVCKICNKSYKTKVSFKTHKILHTGQKPHSCDYCNRQFRTKYILAKHKQTHIGEEPYECDFCDNVFGTRNQLMEHRTVHTGD